MKPTMIRYANSLALATAAVWLVGWTSGPKTVTLPAVGPAPAESTQAAKDGSLEVYSARKRAETDVNRDTFFWNIDYGKNDFLYDAAHTDYTIYGSDGAVFKRVSNARDPNDATPARVKLLPGSYRVEAWAEDYAGVRMKVSVPVVIEAGHTTALHLGGDWKPSGQHKPTELVSLPNGRSVGWRASVTAYVSHPAE